jgi:PAS domain S-box-containing protein
MDTGAPWKGNSPWTRDMKDPEPICIGDVEAAYLPESVKAAVRAERIGALAFFPLVASGDLIGKFMTYYDTPRVFSEAEVKLAVTIARQLGFGIERMRAERTSQLLTSIIVTSDDAIVSKDLNGIVTSWNKGAEQMFGYAAGEMIGWSITKLIPSDRYHEETEILDRIRRGEHIDHYETVRQRNDGSLVDISLTVSPVKDATGMVVGASKISRDISERKQTQARQELLAREVQHRTKNMFAVVLAVVSRSFAGKNTVKDAEAAVTSRLHSLGQTHAMLIDKEWQGVDLAENRARGNGTVHWACAGGRPASEAGCQDGRGLRPYPARARNKRGQVWCPVERDGAGAHWLVTGGTRRVGTLRVPLAGGG